MTMLWHGKCEHCGEVYEARSGNCPDCGTERSLKEVCFCAKCDVPLTHDEPQEAENNGHKTWCIDCADGRHQEDDERRLGIDSDGLPLRDADGGVSPEVRDTDAACDIEERSNRRTK